MAKFESKAEAAEYMREYRKRSPHIFKSMDLKKKYGISLEEYHALLEKQNHVCAICARPETRVDHRTKQTRALAVDHCHVTKKVRGLLCTDCNTALGLFKENIMNMKIAIDYLVGA